MVVESHPASAAPELRIDQAASLEEVREVWSGLASRSGNLFSTWEWAATWWKHYGDGRPLRIGVCRDQTGAPVAILPLYEAMRRPVRVLRMIGHGPADELGPVGEPGATWLGEALIRAARSCGAEALLADRLRADRPPAGEASWAGALGGTLLRRDSSPVIEIADMTWDEYLSSRSSNFRSQVRRKERKLVREQALRYRLCDDPNRLGCDLDALFDLHRARWEGDGSGALEGSRIDFHRDFAAIALDRGWLRLWFAEAGERPVAAWYGFRFGDADLYYQMGRDPSWERSSVGLVLLAHTVREAIADGQREYRLLRGNESYKDRFATGDPGIDTVARALTGRGRLAVAAASRGLSLPEFARRRLTRAIG